MLKIFYALQVSSSSTNATTILEKYAVLPLYLRARVEGWDLTKDDLNEDAEICKEQVKLNRHDEHRKVVVYTMNIKRVVVYSFEEIAQRAVQANLL